MNDSINREKTIAHLKKRLIETAINNTGVRALCDSIFADIADNRIEPWINEIPNAEVEPVKHRRWEWRKEKTLWQTGYYCSGCQAFFGKDYDMVQYFKYCPNCGAKMEGTEHGRHQNVHEV